MQPQSILHSWFQKLADKQHFAKDPALDAEIRTRFRDTSDSFEKNGQA